MTAMTDIGARLKEMRKRDGSSLQEVADSTGASRAHIWELESGRSHNPTLAMLIRLAHHFNVTVADIVGDDMGCRDDRMLKICCDLKGLSDDDKAMIECIIAFMKSRER